MLRNMYYVASNSFPGQNGSSQMRAWVRFESFGLEEAAGGVVRQVVRSQGGARDGR